MKITTLQKSDQDLPDFVRRIYGEIGDEYKRKQIENALLAANPQLSAMQSLQVGALVVLPSIEGFNAPMTEENQAENPRDSMETRVHADLQTYRSQLMAAIEQEMGEINRQLEAVYLAFDQEKAKENDQLKSLLFNLRQRYSDHEERRRTLIA